MPASLLVVICTRPSKREKIENFGEFGVNKAAWIYNDSYCSNIGDEYKFFGESLYASGTILIAVIPTATSMNECLINNSFAGLPMDGVGLT